MAVTVEMQHTGDPAKARGLDRGGDAHHARVLPPICRTGSIAGTRMVEDQCQFGRHCPKRVSPGARETLEVVLAHRLHPGGRGSSARYFSPSSGLGSLRAGSITPKSPAEKIGIPGAAGPAVKKRWLVGPFAEEPPPNCKAQSPMTVKGFPSVRRRVPSK